jgi:hypothetical protein
VHPIPPEDSEIAVSGNSNNSNSNAHPTKEGLNTEQRPEHSSPRSLNEANEALQQTYGTTNSTIVSGHGADSGGSPSSGSTSNNHTSALDRGLCASTANSNNNSNSSSAQTLAAAEGLATPTSRGRILSLVSGFSLSLGRRSLRKVHAEAHPVVLSATLAAATVETAETSADSEVEEANVSSAPRGAGQHVMSSESAALA